MHSLGRTIQFFCKPTSQWNWNKHTTGLLFPVAQCLRNPAIKDYLIWAKRWYSHQSDEQKLYGLSLSCPQTHTHMHISTCMHISYLRVQNVLENKNHSINQFGWVTLLSPTPDWSQPSVSTLDRSCLDFFKIVLISFVRIGLYFVPMLTTTSSRKVPFRVIIVVTTKRWRWRDWQYRLFPLRPRWPGPEWLFYLVN